MPTGLKETEFESAARMLATDIGRAIEIFSMRWGVSPPPLKDQLIDIAGDILTTHFIDLPAVAEQSFVSIFGCNSCALIGRKTEDIAA